ncbi:MAG: guanylate kinase, partial [Chlamydiia bacterium]|nr:guanylate kinase [Chlamydiia bacterium]
CVRESVSVTTRPARSGERNGEHYHFVTQEDFDAHVAAGDFLEHAVVFGNSYGTSRAHVEDQLARGYHVVLVIDTQGALQLIDKYPACFVFVSPPSLDELRTRLLNRKTETPEVIDQRLAWAEREVAESTKYDYHIVNEDLGTAYEVLRSIVIAEEHRVLPRSQK